VADVVGGEQGQDAFTQLGGREFDGFGVLDDAGGLGGAVADDGEPRVVGFPLGGGGGVDGEDAAGAAG